MSDGPRPSRARSADAPARRPGDRQSTALKTGAIRSVVHGQRFELAFDYPVWFTRGAFDPANRVLVDSVGRLEPERRARVLAIFDAGLVAKRPDLPAALTAYVEHHGERLQLVAAPLKEPGGEACKSDPTALERVHHAIHEHGLDRHACIVAVGGGALLDMVGYAAATAHRGIRIVRLPSTVLAQNDAGIGVKNAVNAFGVKNFLGTFAPPFAVIDDLDLLDSLDPRDRLSGIAEAVKVALIRDRAFFERLRRDAVALRSFEDDAVAHMIRRCAELHLEHIATSGDPFEMGSARPLDYGHWAAHKLESLTGHALRHGEAVAIGMALDGCYASMAGLLREEEHESICALLETLGFRLWHPALGERDASGTLTVLAGLDEFRQHLGGELTLTMLRGIGEQVEVHAMDPGLVCRAIEWLERRDRQSCG